MSAPKGFTQHEEEMDVPKGSGVEGFLACVKQVLKLPRVQSINIDSRGKISYTFFLRDGEEAIKATAKFEELMPYAIVRNGSVVEVPKASSNAAIAIAQLFRAAAIDHLYPVAFVTGALSNLWLWYEKSFNLSPDFKEELFGLPLYVDRHAPDEALLMCTAFSRHRDLSETQKTYKVLIPPVTP